MWIETWYSFLVLHFLRFLLNTKENFRNVNQKEYWYKRTSKDFKVVTPISLPNEQHGIWMRSFFYAALLFILYWRYKNVSRSKMHFQSHAHTTTTQSAVLFEWERKTNQLVWIFPDFKILLYCLWILFYTIQQNLSFDIFTAFPIFGCLHLIM